MSVNELLDELSRYISGGGDGDAPVEFLGDFVAFSISATEYDKTNDTFFLIEA